MSEFMYDNQNGQKQNRQNNIHSRYLAP
jgi:hypothetical protein